MCRFRYKTKVIYIKTKTTKNNLTEEDIKKAFTSGGPFTKKGIYNFYANEIDRYGRDPFMVKNIASALNKYNTVFFATFGHGHYCSQRLILEDMLGQPEYIDEVPNIRGDFSDLVLNPSRFRS